MKRSIRIVAAASFLALSNANLYASTQTGTINTVVVANYDAPVAFGATGTRTAKPACASDGWWAIARSGGQNADKMLVLIMTAQATGKSVQIIGTGTCDPDQPTRENVAYIIVG